MDKKTYAIYIMTNQNNTVLYTGVTSNLERRIWEHKNGMGGHFTSKYRATKLVYYETTDRIEAAMLEKNKSRKDRAKKKLG